MKIKIFFNNSCSVCRLEINHYKKISDSNLEWIDITNNNDALKITNLMHLRAMQSSAPGKYEYEIVAEMEKIIRSNSVELAYPSIFTKN